MYISVTQCASARIFAHKLYAVPCATLTYCSIFANISQATKARARANHRNDRLCCDGGDCGVARRLYTHLTVWPFDCLHGAHTQQTTNCVRRCVRVVFLEWGLEM